MSLGFLYIGSAIYLAVVVAGVISINENDSPRRMLRETTRRSVKLLGVLLAAALIVQVLTLVGGS